MVRGSNGSVRSILVLGTAAVLVAGVVAAMGPAQGAYPGANGRIAFETNRDGNLEIYSMNPDGSDQVNLTNDPAEDTDPVWSPDGTRIAFVKASEGHRNIWVMNADGSGQTNLTPGPVTTGQANDGTNPTWSPDGTRIAYASSQGDIWVMNADGAGKTNLTNTPPGVGHRDPAGVVARRHADRLRPRRRHLGDERRRQPTSTRSPPPPAPRQDEKAPDWSPDGTQIVYGKGSAVWRMNADGSGQTQVVANSVLPAWSPDGTRIVFSSSAFGAPNGPDIFTVNPDGTGVTRLPTAAPAIDNDPNWQPVGPPRRPPPPPRARPAPPHPARRTTSTTSTSTTSTSTSSTSTTSTTVAPTSTTTPCPS